MIVDDYFDGEIWRKNGLIAGHMRRELPEQIDNTLLLNLSIGYIPALHKLVTQRTNITRMSCMQLRYGLIRSDTIRYDTIAEFNVKRIKQSTT